MKQEPFLTVVFEIPLVDMNEETLPIPSINYVVEVSMRSSIFASSINLIKMFGQTLEIEC
jgi:hypothetical protein